MVAASHGQTLCLTYLVERAGRQLLSERNDDGLSAACFAVLCGREETLGSIAEIDPWFVLDPDPKGWTATHYAAAEGKVSCLKIMAEACADNEAVLDRLAGVVADGTGGGNVGGGGASLLSGWWGSTSGGGIRVDWSGLSSSSASADRKRQLRYPFTACLDKQGESPLHVAARAGHLKAFAYLVNEAGLRPEDANARGETCLWLAAASGRVSYCNRWCLQVVIKERLRRRYGPDKSFGLRESIGRIASLLLRLLGRHASFAKRQQESATLPCSLFAGLDYVLAVDLCTNSLPSQSTHHESHAYIFRAIPDARFFRFRTPHPFPRRTAGPPPAAGQGGARRDCP